MKPYQLYSINKFPELEAGQVESTSLQMTFSGENEDIRTAVQMEAKSYEASLDLLRISSQVIHKTHGFIKTVIDRQRREIIFNEYLQPVDFPAYYDKPRGLIVLQAKKAVCKGVRRNLNSSSGLIKLTEMEVDFVELMKLRKEFIGAWFQKVSTNVRAARLTGDQIQDDSLFKGLAKMAAMSNVTLPWELDGASHPVMITKSGAIVLVQNYADNLKLELRIVLDVYDKLINNVWKVKPDRRSNDAGCPGEP